MARNREEGSNIPAAVGGVLLAGAIGVAWWFSSPSSSTLPSTGPTEKESSDVARDNRSRQLNPKDEEYKKVRGEKQQKADRDNRSTQINPNNERYQPGQRDKSQNHVDLDNRSMQLNPNNERFHKVRGEKQQRAGADNRSNQLNTNNKEYYKSRNDHNEDEDGYSSDSQ